MPTARRAGAEAKTPARRPRRKRAAERSRGLSAREVAAGVSVEATALAERIAEDGGVALATYREPLGAHPVVLASLPLELVEPTPYQRDVSEPHVKRLAAAMERVGRYLDPVVAIRREGRYLSPNGSHRIAAARLLGARAIVALVLPEPDVAYQILALNTEKAHNVKERSLEVIRMYRGLVGAGEGVESDFAPIFEEPHLVTFGAAYEKRPRISAGAYSPIVKRIEAFLDEPIVEALQIREERAARLLELDDEVVGVVKALKERGLESPYLKYFVIARLNPLRFTRRGTTAEFEPTIAKMIAAARRFDPAKVKREDLSRMGGPPAEAEAEAD